MSDKTKTSLAAQIAASGIDHLADELWENLGGTYPAVVELEVMERTEPSDTEADRKVKLRVVGIEIPRTALTKEELRQLRRRLYADRTGDDTLFAGNGSGTERDDQGRVTSATFTSKDAERLGQIADDLLEHDQE